MNQTSCVTCLKAAAASTIVLGLLMAAAASIRFAAPAAFLLDLVFYPVDAAQTMQDPALRLLSAIGGGLAVGFGSAIWLVANHLVPRDPALARKIILVSLGAWFLVDSTGSIVSGGHWNVLGNVLFLLAFAIPALFLPRAQLRSS
jgi:hypothetical protein